MRDVLSEKERATTENIAAAYGGHNLRAFRSTGRLLVLVAMDRGRTLFDLLALEEDLSEALGKKVNVLTEASLSPYLRDSVLADAEKL
jgi:predicted nucleotidyltransferase